METYLTMLYVTLEQELALKDFFSEKGWAYCKPDLRVITDKAGPFEKPKCIKKITGRILTLSALSENDGSETNTTSRVSKRRVIKKPSRYVHNDNIETDSKTTKKAQNTSAQCELKYENIEEEAHSENGISFNDDLYNEIEDCELENSVDESEVSTPKECKAGYVKTSVSPDGRKKMVIAIRRKEVLIDAEDQAKLRPIVLVKDLYEQNDSKKPPKPKLKCSLCPRQYLFQTNLDKHMEIAHNPNKPLKKRTRTPPSRQCDICGKVFKRSDILKNHRQTIHQGLVSNVKKILPGTCDICGKTFTRRNHLKEHVLMKHSDSKLPFPCTMCEKSFMRSAFLDRHVNKEHLKVRPYDCKLCNKRFYNESAVKKHMNDKICQPDRFKRFKCTQCMKKFSTSSNLEMHMTAVHFGGAYRCVCGHVVKYAGSIAKHKRNCAAYQEYIEINGKVEDKVCNVIEVPYEDVYYNNAENTVDVDSTIENTLEIVAATEALENSDKIPEEGMNSENYG